MINNIDVLKNITILYAEDEDDLRDVTVSILKTFTKNQLVAKNGKEAYDIFLKHEDEIDLIITDINMPILNGLDFIKQIKEINVDIPVIVTTAFSNKEYLLEAIDIGVDKYVLKPIDITKLLQAMSQSLIYHELKDLYTDKLTKLSNRNKLKKDLSKNDYDLVALIDIDEFATINDLFGEAIGDKILYEFTQKLLNYFPKDYYSIYRIESDKFSILAKNHSSVDEFYNFCRVFIDKIELESFYINDNEIDINITIGIAKSKGLLAYKYSQRIISYARRKFQKIMIYDESYQIQQSFEENLKWIKQLKQGFKDNLLKAFFQPIVDSKTKEIVKYEALIRYISPEGVEFGPYSFLKIAKKTKMYPNIVQVILNDSLKLIKNKNKRVSINISYDDLSNEKTTPYIYDFLDKNQEYTKNLEFEILESEEISDFDLVERFIAKVSKYGCGVGIDDFGAGYSNFHLLSRLNVNFIKIDGSLIKDIDKLKDLEIIVKTISNISKEFNIKTVAEFVSSEEIFNKIKELNIDMAQGFYFSKPISYDEIN
jgi:diguanylate cyclase (GGDEF)-like protein